MHKLSTATAALLLALVLPVFGAAAAPAAEPRLSAPLPADTPSPTPSPAGSSPAVDDHDKAAEDHESMPGMEHGADSGEEPPGSEHDSMPGMDHGEASITDGAESNGSAGGESHAHSEDEGTSEPRPVAALVGGFAALNGAVLLSAVLLRRRDRRLAAGSRRSVRTAQ